LQEQHEEDEVEIQKRHGKLIPFRKNNNLKQTNNNNNINNRVESKKITEAEAKNIYDQLKMFGNVANPTNNNNANTNTNNNANIGNNFKFKATNSLNNLLNKDTNTNTENEGQESVLQNFDLIRKELNSDKSLDEILTHFENIDKAKLNKEDSFFGSNSSFLEQELLVKFKDINRATTNNSTKDSKRSQTVNQTKKQQDIKNNFLKAKLLQDNAKRIKSNIEPFHQVFHVVPNKNDFKFKSKEEDNNVNTVDKVNTVDTNFKFKEQEQLKTYSKTNDKLDRRVKAKGTSTKIPRQFALSMKNTIEKPDHNIFYKRINFLPMKDDFYFKEKDINISELSLLKNDLPHGTNSKIPNKYRTDHFPTKDEIMDKIFHNPETKRFLDQAKNSTDIKVSYPKDIVSIYSINHPGEKQVEVNANSN